jgi:hypothetical protein
MTSAFLAGPCEKAVYPISTPVSRRFPAAGVLADHDVGIEHGEEASKSPSRAAARKASTTSRCADGSALRVVSAPRMRRRPRLASWRTASGERSGMAPISSKGTENMSRGT